MIKSKDYELSRRDFVHGAVSSAVLVAGPTVLMAASATSDKATVMAQIPKQHADNIRRLHDMIVDFCRAAGFTPR